MISYTAPAKWTPAIINNDFSYMNENEIVAVKNWLNSLPGPVIDVVDGGYYKTLNPTHMIKHDAYDYYPEPCDCYDFLIDA